MSERITSIEVDSLEGTSKSKLSFSGFSYDLVGADMDARITKLTGLEAPSLNVTGGASSFGGSVYTGVTMSDREVVLTVKPTGSTNKSIKNRLSALINRSKKWPLRFRVHTMRDDGTVSSLTSETYISGVSSPIFEKSDEVQITFKMAQPHLERGPVVLGKISSGLPPIPIPVHSHYNLPTQDHHNYGLNIPLEFDYNAMNADSPFSVNFTFNVEASAKLKSLTIRDVDMNRVMINVGDAVANTNLGIPRYNITYDGRNRSVSTYLDANSAGFEDLRNHYDYSYFIEPTWPVLGPDSGSIFLEVTLNGQFSGNVRNSVNFERVVVWPRMLGV